jgi:hypothetical protein
MNNLFVTFDKFDHTKLVKTSIDAKTAKQTDPKTGEVKTIPYNTTALKYEYETINSKGEICRVIDNLAIEFPELYSPSGIMRKTNQQGFETASLFTQFDITKPEIDQATKMGPNFTGGPMDSLYQWVCERVWECKGQLPSIMAKLSGKHSLSSVVSYPIYFTKNSETLEIVAGSRPSKYFNLMCYGKEGSATRKETLFKAPTGDAKKGFATIPWSLLTNVELKFIPVVTFKQVYMGGGKVSIQFEITSAVVTSVSPSNSTSAQVDTLARLASDVDLSNNVADQIAVLQKRMAPASAETPSDTPHGGATSLNKLDSPKPVEPTTSTHSNSAGAGTPHPTPAPISQLAFSNLPSVSAGSILHAPSKVASFFNTPVSSN